MNILEIIAKKRDGFVLNKDEINFFIQQYCLDNIKDYQAAALIMAIYINGMNDQETIDLTIAMAESGSKLDLSSLGIIVDKHSTGGVGDKATLILTPIIASLGIPVAKLSGRGLGFTGGTIDKLEAIPGFKVELNTRDFIENIRNIGISIIGQTADLAPADKKIYALRDAINCVGSIPLIASSIMSKKIASGANKIVLDVTVGSGAFMKTIENALDLAEIMTKIGKLANRETVCILTNMDEPLGYSIGNTLEILEVIESLNGNIKSDVLEVVATLGAHIIKLYSNTTNIEENKKLILENIYNKKAYDKFLELVKIQGGDISYIENIEKFEKANYIIPLIAKKTGYVKELNAEKIGNIAMKLGAGRIKKDDMIDKSAGIILYKKIGDMVKIGDKLAQIHTNKEEIIEEMLINLENTYIISDEKVKNQKIILEEVF